MLTRPVRLPLIRGRRGGGDSQQWWQPTSTCSSRWSAWGAVAAGPARPPFSDVNLGGQQADPLMLMALLFLALVSLALRFFPILAGALARGAAAGRGLVDALASWQLSREPVHYGRITFLLALAVGIGWFATSFRATVSNSHADQARYLVGTDARLVERDTALNANRARPASYYTEQETVAAASTAYRVRNANLSTSTAGDLRTILGIDPTLGPALLARRPRPDLHSAPGDPPPLAEWCALPVVPERVSGRAQTAFVSSGGLRPASAPDARTACTCASRRRRRVVGARQPVEVEYPRQADAPGVGARVVQRWVYMEGPARLAYTPQAGAVSVTSMQPDSRSASAACA